MKKLNLSLLAFVFFGFSLQLDAEETEPTFTITGPGISKSFTRSDLLNSKNLKSLVVEQDPAYLGKKMTYLAVPLAQIFEGVSTETISTMSFKCLDGFSGGISKTRALNKDPKGSIAYIAVEKEGQKWPKLKMDKAQTAGPFYLIWENPEKSKIMTEEWPYQLAGFDLSDKSYASLFPNTVPENGLKVTDPVMKGHALFMTNCFVCHAFNGEGSGKIGPDLNLPFSPTEYLQKKFFLPFVRSPQNLRKWDQERMPNFNESGLTDNEIENIWNYFAYMSKRKKP